MNISSCLKKWNSTNIELFFAPACQNDPPYELNSIIGRINFAKKVGIEFTSTPSKIGDTKLKIRNVKKPYNIGTILFRLTKIIKNNKGHTFIEAAMPMNSPKYV
jgi:hypothetical protein